ncbi:RNA-dependent RNA polymerase [Broome reovirus]|uniref:RNA-directed RNA polymerase n=1 Tax=Broome reovirus TaxID=667093 RepID=D6MM22_9REOV|nr:RNA-dependent RNA polymerase [Broome reovirus]ACU68602.1 RNA-dependent RNA polymerase [Broome reovirus]
MGDYVPPVFAAFQRYLSGLEDLDYGVFSNTAMNLQLSDRSELYRWLDKVQFRVNFSIPVTLFNKPSHAMFYYIDGANLVRRRQLNGELDLYVPNCKLFELLEPTERLPNYGRLRKVLNTAAADGHVESRIAVSYYNTVNSQARQIKGPLERFLQCLLIAESCPLGNDPTHVEDNDGVLPIETNLPLYVLREVARRITGNSGDRAPWLFTATEILWFMSPLMTSAIAPLMIDLANLAIMRQICRLPDVVTRAAVTMYLNAADSHSYSQYVLETKGLLMGASLHSMYRTAVSGIVPVVEWSEPRSKYKFSYQGVRNLTSRDYNHSWLCDDDLLQRAAKFGLRDVINDILTCSKKVDKHDFESVKWIRNVMAGTSSIFIVRAPTETVIAEYSQTPVILEPIPEEALTMPIGEVRCLRNVAPSTPKFLYDVWRDAARDVCNRSQTWDALEQVIMRSQYVTARGGSGAALRDVLKNANIELPSFNGVKVKSSTKIVQAAQVAGLSFMQLKDAILAPLSMGLRNQIQRRQRSIMPLNVVQQQVSAIHTLVADHINKHVNLSTTSGSAVIEKVLPMGMYASSPPNQTINIDIKACDASITCQYFLSIICGAIFDGCHNVRVTSPYMGVPPTRLRVIGDDGIASTMPISGMQHMVQSLATLYNRGFAYKVNDPFCPGNTFTHHTLTFPSGSTATSTEHTANNSTMMDGFLRIWLPDHCKEKDVLALAERMSIQRNYVCQGDDGIMIIDSNNIDMIDGDLIKRFCQYLKQYGETFGWNYDIDFNGTTEYLKLYFIYGCRIPNISRHPVINKERATQERSELWPATIDIMMGVFWNGVHDGLHWRQWIRFCWCLAALYSRKINRDALTPRVIQYSPWAFVYLGLPPIRAFGSHPYPISVYLPTGDMGFYALLTVLKPFILAYADARGYNADSEGLFGPIDHVRLFNDLKLYQGYYMAQLPRRPVKTSRTISSNDRARFLTALHGYVFEDPVLRMRVARGRHMWHMSGFEKVKHPPSLEDVPRKWLEGAQEADVATLEEINAMDDVLMNAMRHTYSSFSKLLECYLSVEWDYEYGSEPAIDLRVPICAGYDPENADMYFKMTSLGPMMSSTKKYFSDKLFIGKTVSGLDVEAVDKSLLRLRALGAPRDAIIGQLMMLGYDFGAASTLAGRILLQNVHAVQLAKVVNLAVPDSWMIFDFDRMLHERICVFPKVSRKAFTDIAPHHAWIKGVLRLLGGAVAMSIPGVVPKLYLSEIRGGSRSMSLKLRHWMAKEVL